MRTMRTKTLVSCAMLVAVGVVLSFFVDVVFPFIPAASFLRYDPSGIPMLIASLLFGPLAGSLVTILTCVLHGLTTGFIGGPIGLIMNILGGLAMVIPAGMLFKRLRGRRGGLVISLAISGICMVAANIVFNLILTPIYMGAPLQTVVALILPALLPFNIVKAILNGVFAGILYTALSRFLGEPAANNLPQTVSSDMDGTTTDEGTAS